MHAEQKKDTQFKALTKQSGEEVFLHAIFMKLDHCLHYK